jgi:hypothetical protein
MKNHIKRWNECKEFVRSHCHLHKRTRTRQSTVCRRLVMYSTRACDVRLNNLSLYRPAELLKVKACQQRHGLVRAAWRGCLCELTQWDWLHYWHVMSMHSWPCTWTRWPRNVHQFWACVTYECLLLRVVLSSRDVIITNDWACKLKQSLLRALQKLQLPSVWWDLKWRATFNWINSSCHCKHSIVFSLPAQRQGAYVLCFLLPTFARAIFLWYWRRRPCRRLERLEHNMDEEDVLGERCLMEPIETGSRYY